MSIVYLADGREIRTEVQDSYGRGTVNIDGRAITVERLAKPFQYRGYGELVSIKLKSGIMMGAVLQPQEYEHHRAIVDIGEIEAEATRRRNPGDVVIPGKPHVIEAVYNHQAEQWVEMPEPKGE